MKNPPITVIVLTYNEEANIRICLESVKDLTDKIFIVDSYSTDRTVEITKDIGAKVFQNAFVNMAQQRNWALDNLPFSTGWVMFLDADERPTPELKEELVKKLGSLPDDVGGLYARRRFMWLGRWLRHGGMYKWVLRIVKRDRAHVEMAGRREYMHISGRTWRLEHDFIHEDKKGVADWISKHNKFSGQEIAELAVWGNNVRSSAGSKMNTGDGETEGAEIIHWRQYWNRLPLFFRPFLSFFIKYVLMLGILDGISGLTYYFLHDFWYPFLVDVKYLELKREKNNNDNS